MDIEKPNQFESKNFLSKQEEDQIVDTGVKKAQEIGQSEGLKIGQIVVHPSDEYAYELKEINGNEAIVWFPGQKETIKTFPFDELFDPNVAKNEAIQESANRQFKKNPEINN